MDPQTRRHNQMDPQTRRHNQKIMLIAREGDLLEFPRSAGYSHWAVYIGKERVIHLAGEIDAGFSSENVFVREDIFWDVTEESRTQIRNLLDGTEKVLPDQEIVARARSKLGYQGYNLAMTNCEHFATWCRYGRARSLQVETIEAAISHMGAQVQEILIDAAASHPDQRKRQQAKFGLGLVHLASLVKQKYVEANKSDQLKGLTSGNGGSSAN